MKWQTANTIEYDLLKENAKANRKNETEAESIFWQLAKGKGLGQKCRRQYIIGQYIVDFFFRESLLIVEIDGEYHFTEQQQEEDTLRQGWLEERGYKVLRFSNTEIINDIESVIRKTKDNLII